MKKFREAASRKQQTLLPRSVEEYVPVEDLVRYIDSLVDELDLTEIEGKYSVLGRPAFSPRVMVKLLVYGKIRGLRSSRELSQACRENLKFIYITSGEQPDYRTISLFRQRFCKELAGILRQTIVIGLNAGVIDLKHVAIDGSLVRSFAGENSFKTPEQISKELEFLERSIKQDDEPSEEDDDDSGGGLPKQLQDSEKLKAKLKEALKKYKSYEGKPKRERPKKVSITDPDCRYMRKGPAYNGQAAVDESSRMVVAGFATSAVSDASQLTPVLKEISSNTAKNPEKITADAGYNARAGLAELEKRKIEGYVPQRENTSKGFPIESFTYDKNSDTYICPGGKALKFKGRNQDSLIYVAKSKDCKLCQLRSSCVRFSSSVVKRTLCVSVYNNLVKEMKKKTASDLGKKMARKRSSTIETLFAHLKYVRKLRRFIFRGMNMVDKMWKFELAVYNLEQIIRHQKVGLIEIT
jgi:transposase